MCASTSSLASAREVRPVALSTHMQVVVGGVVVDAEEGEAEARVGPAKVSVVCAVSSALMGPADLEGRASSHT